MKRVIFVCTGNTCRSPMAEAIFSMLCKQQKINAYGESCGIGAFEGMSASENAVSAIDELYSLDISAHRSRQISQSLIDSADFIFVMTPRHAQAISQNFSNVQDKLYIPKSDISDPYMSDLSVYKQCALDLKNAISLFIEQRIK